MGYGLVHRTALFKLLVFIDAIFDKYLFERSEVQNLLCLAFLYEQLLMQQGLGVLDADAQQVAHAHEVRLVVVDDTAVGRDAHLAVGEGIEGIDGLVGRGTGYEVNQYLGMLGRIVVDLANLDFPLLLRFEYRLDERRGGLAVGYLDDGEGAVVELLDFGTHLHAAAPLAVVVFGHVDEAAGLEIGIEVKLFAPQIGHSRFQNFVEIVGQNL